MDIIDSIIEQKKIMGESCVIEICVTDRMKNDYYIVQKYLVLTHKTYNYFKNNIPESFKKMQEIPTYIDDQRFLKYLQEVDPIQNIINKELEIWRDN